MNSLATLVFPETTIHSVRQYPIFLLLQNLHLLAPVEADPAKESAEPSDSFIKSGFCQVYTPRPLGALRPRFLRLLHDLKTRRDDYAAQLSSLTLAAIATPPQPVLEDERSLVNELLGKSTTPLSPEKKRPEDALWQARLVLAIGELLDREEEEIAVQLAELADEERELFRELHGEEDDEEESPLAGLGTTGHGRKTKLASNSRQRFKAWLELFLAGPGCPGEQLLTFNPDCADFLEEIYEKMSGRATVELCQLPLPQSIGATAEEAGEAVRQFVADHDEELTEFARLLASLEATPWREEEKEQAVAALCAVTTQLAASLTHTLRQPEEEGSKVRILLLPGLSCRAVLGAPLPEKQRSINGVLIVVE